MLERASQRSICTFELIPHISYPCLRPPPPIRLVSKTCQDVARHSPTWMTLVQEDTGWTRLGIMLINLTWKCPEGRTSRPRDTFAGSSSRSAVNIQLKVKLPLQSIVVARELWRVGRRPRKPPRILAQHCVLIGCLFQDPSSFLGVASQN